MDGAVRWYSKYLDALRSLPDRAAGCPSAPEADLLHLDLRQILFQTRKGRVYRSLFVIRNDAIHVVCVRGAGQDLATSDDLDLPE